jgi:hypothetical protein
VEVFEMQTANIIKDILFEDGYSSSDDLLKDWSRFVALSRIEQYRAEKEAFEQRYGLSLAAFENEIHAHKGLEDFEKEENLEDWEFTCKALIWWEDKLIEIQNV